MVTCPLPPLTIKRGVTPHIGFIHHILVVRPSGQLKLFKMAPATLSVRCPTILPWTSFRPCLATTPSLKAPTFGAHSLTFGSANTW